MRIGIVGGSQVGKSTIFQLLTNTEAGSGAKARNVGIARIPDERIDRLSAMYNPKKTTYATIEFVDIFGQGESRGKVNESLGALRDVDALLQVIRTFRSDIVPTDPENGNPIGQINQIQQELILHDWSILENRLERIASQRNKVKLAPGELEVLNKCRETLEADLPLRSADFSAEEEALIRTYDFLTTKPLIIAVNADEDQVAQGDFPERDAVEEWASRRGVPLVILGGQIEVEISQLEADDRQEFMADLGLEESGIARLAQAIYAHLGLISFFTVGEDEVRAWTIRKGSTAKESAGKIHSDIARGFIRAEVVSYDVLMELGNMQRVKEKGLFRLEGKDYVVQDGDIINFRFNV